MYLFRVHYSLIYVEGGEEEEEEEEGKGRRVRIGINHGLFFSFLFFGSLGGGSGHLANSINLPGSTPP